MWKVFKLASGRFEIYKEVDGNSVETLKETFGTPEQANAVADKLNNPDEKPVDSVQPPAPETTVTPAADPAAAADQSANADESKSDAEQSGSETAPEGSAQGEASSEAAPADSAEPGAAPADNGTGAQTGEPAV